VFARSPLLHTRLGPPALRPVWRVHAVTRGPQLSTSARAPNPLVIITSIIIIIITTIICSPELCCRQPSARWRRRLAERERESERARERPPAAQLDGWAKWRQLAGQLGGQADGSGGPKQPASNSILLASRRPKRQQQAVGPDRISPLLFVWPPVYRLQFPAIMAHSQAGGPVPSHSCHQEQPFPRLAGRHSPQAARYKLATWALSVCVSESQRGRREQRAERERKRVVSGWCGWLFLGLHIPNSKFQNFPSIWIWPAQSSAAWPSLGRPQSCTANRPKACSLLYVSGVGLAPAPTQTAH